MKNRIGVMLVLAMIVVPIVVGVVMAQTPSPNGVTISGPQTSPGQVYIQGNSTVATGYTFGNIVVYVQPTGGVGGEGGANVVTTDSAGNFSTFVQVPPGATYDIQACLKVMDDGGNLYYFYSNTITGVYVPTISP
jgi:hypothetical protein